MNVVSISKIQRMDLEKFEKLKFFVSVCQVNRLLLLAHQCSPVRQSVRWATPALPQVVHSIDIRKYHSFTLPGLRGGLANFEKLLEGVGWTNFSFEGGLDPEGGSIFEGGWLAISKKFCPN